MNVVGKGLKLVWDFLIKFRGFSLLMKVWLSILLRTRYMIGFVSIEFDIDLFILVVFMFLIINLVHMRTLERIVTVIGLRNITGASDLVGNRLIWCGIVLV
jgi:hypothetical protein